MGLIAGRYCSHLYRKHCLNALCEIALNLLRGLVILDSEGWVVQSENVRNPLMRDNVQRRFIQPKLANIGLGWVTFQVMRRTNASLSHKQGVDPKVAADQRGHGLGVSMEVYTQTDLEQKLKAVRSLETVREQGA